MNKLALLPLSLSTLSLAPLELLDLGGSFGSLPIYDLYTFIGSYKADTNVQNIGVDGNTLNLMPLGTVTSTSTHSTPILAPDKDGVYQEYPVDAPVWKGANWNGGAPLYDNLPDVYLQANKAATNLSFPSNFAGFNSSKFLVEDNGPSSIFPWNSIKVTLLSGQSSASVSLYQNTGSVIGDTQFARLFIENINAEVMSIGVIVGGWQSLITYTFATDSYVVAAGATPLYFNTQIDNGIIILDIQVEIIDAGTSSFLLYPVGLGQSTNSAILHQVDVHLNDILGDLLTYSPILTTTAAVSIPATNYTFPAVNIDPSDALIEFDMEYEGDNTNVLAIGATQLLEIGYFLGDGNELVTNGTFDTNIDGWTAGESTISWENGAIRIIGNGTITNHVAKFGLNGLVEVGGVYIVKFQVVEAFTSSGVIINQTRIEEGNDLHYWYTSVTGNHVSLFTCYATGSNYIALHAGSDGAATALFDNASIQKAVKAIKLSDGTNSVALPVTLGNNKVAANLTADTMTLTVGGSSVSGPYVPVAAGLITVEENTFALASKVLP